MPRTNSPLFLGPTAENAAVFEDLLRSVVRDHSAWRVRTSGVNPRAAELRTQTLERELRVLLEELHGSVPFSSPRYIAHMTGDATLPSLLGYISALLYNPNNISAEASPVTTRLELEVAADLAKMIGYRAEGHWTHLTSGGTIANAEALWVARSIKYLPVALRWAADELGLESFVIERPNGWHIRLREARLWQLLNVTPTAALDAAERMGRLIGKDSAARAVARWSLGAMGDQAFGRRLADCFPEVLAPAVVLVPGTAHYSWDKIARMTGVGSAQVRRVPVDAHFRMSTDALRETVTQLAREQRPILTCVAVVGSTEEGSVDPLFEICELKDELAASMNISFHLHADAAYGGYAAAATWKADGARAPVRAGKFPSAHVSASLQALSRTDSVTIDPHKLGFAPYPAGAVSFRDGRSKVLCASDAPYVFSAHTTERSALGRFTFEGSRPGAPAAALALSHRVLPLHERAHGALISSCVASAARLRAALVRRNWGAFRLVPLPQSDLNLVGFTFTHPGLKTLPEQNAFIDRLHTAYSTFGSTAPRYFVSRTVLRPFEYGTALQPLLSTLGFTLRDCEDAGGIHVLRCTVMHPTSVLTASAIKPFVDHLALTLDASVIPPLMVQTARVG